jgi:outer membrane protein OmpA-like peptidoglycan-associated protein
VAHGSEDTNDQHDIAYQYLERKTAGTLEFEAPAQAGAWDFRMNENDASGREIASVSFTVRAPDVRGAALRLDRTTFNSGETIALHFTAPADLPPHAWIGIVPSKVPHGKEDVNDANDVDWQYLEKKTSGTLEFRAPVEGGAWDFRMNENESGGREIASVSFTVGAQVSAADLARQIKAQGRVSLYGIRFATGKADLDATATATLTEVGKLLKSDPSLSLRIEGHTDDVGDEASNQDLSRRRAEAVRSYLVQREGIAAARLTAEGFGESRPVAKNDTPAGKAQNRRVELVRR